MSGNDMSDAMRRFVRYQAVGIATFFADLIVVSLLLFLLNLNYLLATVLGYICAVVIAFVINRRWSFEKWVGTWRVLISLAVNSVVLMAIVYITYEGVSYFHAPYYVARVAAALVAAVLSYLGDSLFTFQVLPHK